MTEKAKDKIRELIWSTVPNGYLSVDSTGKPRKESNKRAIRKQVVAANLRQIVVDSRRLQLEAECKAPPQCLPDPGELPQRLQLLRSYHEPSELRNAEDKRQHEEVQRCSLLLGNELFDIKKTTNVSSGDHATAKNGVARRSVAFVTSSLVEGLQVEAEVELLALRRTYSSEPQHYERMEDYHAALAKEDHAAAAFLSNSAEDKAMQQPRNSSIRQVIRDKIDKVRSQLSLPRPGDEEVSRRTRSSSPSPSVFITQTTTVSATPSKRGSCYESRKSSIRVDNAAPIIKPSTDRSKLLDDPPLAPLALNSDPSVLEPPTFIAEVSPCQSDVPAELLTDGVPMAELGIVVHSGSSLSREDLQRVGEAPLHIPIDSSAATSVAAQSIARHALKQLDHSLKAVGRVLVCFPWQRRNYRTADYSQCGFGGGGDNRQSYLELSRRTCVLSACPRPSTSNSIAVKLEAMTRSQCERDRRKNKALGIDDLDGSTDLLSANGVDPIRGGFASPLHRLPHRRNELLEEFHRRRDKGSAACHRPIASPDLLTQKLLAASAKCITTPTTEKRPAFPFTGKRESLAIGHQSHYPVTVNDEDYRQVFLRIPPEVRIRAVLSLVQKPVPCSR